MPKQAGETKQEHRNDEESCENGRTKRMNEWTDQRNCSKEQKRKRNEKKRREEKICEKQNQKR